MSGKEEEFESGKYMIRRKFYVPKKEMFRDYRTFDSHPSNFLFKCDYDEADEDSNNDEDKICGN